MLSRKVSVMPKNANKDGTNAGKGMTFLAVCLQMQVIVPRKGEKIPCGIHINIFSCVVAGNWTTDLLEKSPTLNHLAIVSFVLEWHFFLFYSI